MAHKLTTVAGSLHAPKLCALAVFPECAPRASSSHRLADGLERGGQITLARRLEETLRLAGSSVLVLDGDEVRHGLNRDLGFAPRIAKKTYAASLKWRSWPMRQASW